MSFKATKSLLSFLVLNNDKRAAEFINRESSWKSTIHPVNKFEMFLSNFCGVNSIKIKILLIRKHIYSIPC